MSAHEDSSPEGTVVIKSPMPAVWGITVGGEFWWDVEHDRYCVRQDPPHSVDLYAGGYCDEHLMMEGTLCGTTPDLREALSWISGGPRPRGATLQ